jgi:tetratricopeptide (TPR) repeat protein
MSAAVDSLLAQATRARRERRPADAQRDLIQAVALCRQSDDRLPLAMALTGLGQIERDLHHAAEALEHYEEAAAIFRAAGDPLKLAHTVRHIADIHQDEAHLALAAPYYDETLSIYRAHPETPPLDLANAVRGQALLKETMGETHDATALWEEARALYSQVNVEAGVTESARHIALLQKTHDQPL